MEKGREGERKREKAHLIVSHSLDARCWEVGANGGDTKGWVGVVWSGPAYYL